MLQGWAGLGWAELLWGQAGDWEQDQVLLPSDFPQEEAPVLSTS